MRQTLFALAFLVIVPCCSAESFITEASYYTRASCAREGTSGIMANGKELNDEACTAASWDFPFGTRLRVQRVGREDLSAVVTVTDRGPAKKLYKRDRRIDLSLKAARCLGIVERGIAKVKVEVISGPILVQKIQGNGSQAKSKRSLSSYKLSVVEGKS